MKYVYTEGNNKDFNLLCQMLDDYLNDVVGGEKQRKQYTRYNTTEDNPGNRNAIERGGEIISFNWL